MSSKWLLGCAVLALVVRAWFGFSLLHSEETCAAAFVAAAESDLIGVNFQERQARQAKEDVACKAMDTKVQAAQRLFPK